MRDFFTLLPKVELHVHLEGTLEPADLFNFARRNGVDVPWSSESELAAAYQYEGLSDFLTLYWQGCPVLSTRQDFQDLSYSYLRRAAAQGVRRAEMFFSPQNFLPRGITMDDQLSGLTDGIVRAEEEFGVQGGMIIVQQRHRDESEAFDLLRQLAPYRDLLLGVGLGGPEKGNPPSKFSRFFASARKEGYELTAHAGEEGPADYVWQALDECGVNRIDHGFTAVEDPRLVERLAQAGTTLTMCPLSNLRLGVLDSLVDYPLQSLLDAGVRVTINSDDPPYFGGWIADNYSDLATSLDLDRGTILQLARNSFTGSWAPQDWIDISVAELDSWTSPDVDRGTPLGL